MNKGMLFLGGILIFVGLVYLLGMIIKIDTGVFCFPLALIILGVWLLVRPALAGYAGPSETRIIGDLRRSGAWQVTSQEFWMGIGSIDLDLTSASIPAGETRLHFNGLVGDVRLHLPAEVGYSLTVNAMVADAKVFDYQRESVFNSIELDSQNYAAAERRLKLEISYFVVDVKIDGQEGSGHHRE